MRILFIALALLSINASALDVVGGDTSLLTTVHMYATDGTDLTGLAFGDMTITYTRNTASSDVDVTEATMALGTWASGGWIEIDSVNSPGDYQFGVVDAAIATGAEEVRFSFRATGAVSATKNIGILAVDLRTSANVAANIIQVGGSAASTVGYVPIDLDDVSGTLDNAEVADDVKVDVNTIGGSTASLASYVPVDFNDIQGTLDNAEVANDIDMNVYSISTDVTAADNLELQYDTTGLAGETFPSTQAQLSNIATGAGGLSTTAASATVTIGSETNTFEQTKELDLTYHTVTDVTNNTDFYYEFDVGSVGIGTDVTWNGYVQSNGDDYVIEGYDWIATDWSTIGSLAGLNGTTPREEVFILTTAMTGTGANLGTVRFRVTSSDGQGFATDRILIQYTALSQTVGYANGAIWVDTVNGTAGTELYVNGTADNPVSSWGSALAISSALGVQNFHISGGSSIQLSDDTSNFELTGSAYDLDLNGQTVTNATFSGARVSGIGVNTGTAPVFNYCGMGATTLGPSRFYQCGIGRGSGTLTAGSAGQFALIDCFSLVPGSGSPSLVFSGTGGTTGINNRGWKGGATYTLDSNCTLSHEVVAGGGTTITTGGGDVEVRGITRSLTLVLSAAETVQFVGVTGPIALSGTTTATVNLYGVSASLTDSTSAATVSDETNSTTNFVDGNWDAVLTGSTHNIPTSAGRRLREIAGTVIWAGTSQGAGSNGNQIVLDTGASSVDGAYDPALVAIVEGTGAGQSRLVYQYEGSTRTATVDRSWKVNPSTDSEFIIYADPGREHVNEGLAQSGSPTTLVLNANASSVDDEYNGQMLFLRSGAGEDQVRLVTSYAGSTKTVTVHEPWGTTPNGTTAYAMLPRVTPHDAWDVETSGHTTVGSFGADLAQTGDAMTLEDDAITAAKLAADAIVEIQSGLATAASIVALNDFDPANDTVARVTLVDTTTTNTDMRGTDSAAQAGDAMTLINDAITAAKLAADAIAEIQAGLATSVEVAALNDFDPASDTVARVTLVDTTTTNTDMRGTDSAATAIALAALNDFDHTSDTVARVTLVDTTTTNTDMRGTENAATAIALAALNDFDPANDTVARVTLVDTTTTNTDMRGTDSAAVAGDEMALIDDAITDAKITTAFLAAFVNTDTGETDSVDGSVAKLSGGASSGGGATAQEVWEYAGGRTVNGVTPEAGSVNMTFGPVYKPDNVTVLINAEITISTDSARVNIIDTQYTDQNGKAVFQLSDGATLYYSIRHPEISDLLGIEFSVTED